MKFAVLGLGYFGTALCRELAGAGHEVMAVDNNRAHIDEVKDEVSLAARADATDYDALEQLGVGQMDAAIVAIGEGFEASLMITAHCQKLGVPRVYTRVISPVQEHLLDLMKVTGKVRAESLAAAYFSRQLTNRAVHRYFGLDRNHAIVELALPPGLVGKTLEESRLRADYGLNLVTVRCGAQEVRDDEQDGATVRGVPDASFVFHEGDRLILFGRNADIEKFTAQWLGE